MAVRKISTSISLEGDAEFKRQLKEVDRELANLSGEMKLNTARFADNADSIEALTKKDELLRKKKEQLEEKVRALNDAVKKSGKYYGESSETTDKYRQQLNRAETALVNVQRELRDTERAMESMSDETEKAADSMDDFQDKTKSSGDNIEDFLKKVSNGGGLGDFVGKLGNLKGILAGGAIAVGVKELTGAILEVEESTREYRKIMGTLQTSSEAAGYTAEQTSEAFDRMYGVLGDTQTAATTVANLQAIGMSQNDLMELIDATTGAWAEYGDSIPIDSLAESINETIKVGQVTGTFADVLNWGAKEGETFGLTLKDNIEFTELSSKELARLSDSQREQYEATKRQYDETEAYNEALQDCSSAEDYFNLALQQCTSDADKANLMMKVLSDQGLSMTGKAWRDNNEDIIKMNEAQAELNEAMGRMGEMLAPLAATLVSFGADALGFVIDKVKSAVDWFKELNQKLNESGKQRVIAAGGTYYEEVDGSHAGGLSRVPYDGYIAEVHKDEAILTAAEARTWRSIQGAGGQSGTVRHDHTGTIRVEGVTDEGQLAGVVDIIVEELRQEARR